VSIWHVGVAVSAAIACSDSQAQLNHPSAALVKLALRLLYICCVGIYLPLHAYHRGSRAGGVNGRPHSLRWIAMVWHVFQMRERVVTRAPVFIATLDSQLVTIVAILSVTLLDGAAPLTVVFCFLHLSKFCVRGSIHNNNIAFDLATVTDRVEQYALHALHRTLLASLVVCSDAGAEPRLRESTDLLHVHCEGLLLNLVQRSRPDMYYTPITVRVVLDSLLEQLATAWEQEGLEVQLDRRRVDFPAALMQELQVHPGAFLRTVCEAINRVATDVLMFKSEDEAPMLSITPFLRQARQSHQGILRVAVSQRIRGITDEDEVVFATPFTSQQSDEQRWGAFMNGARKLRAECGEVAWLAGTPCTTTADYSQMGGVYTISIDTPISRACHAHTRPCSTHDVRKLRMHSSTPEHTSCVCQLLAPHDLNIGEVHAKHGLIRCAIQQCQQQRWPIGPRTYCRRPLCSTGEGADGALLPRPRSSPGSSGFACALKSCQGKYRDKARVHMQPPQSGLSTSPVVASGASLEYLWTARSDSVSASETYTQPGSGSQLYTMLSLPPALQQFTSLNEEDETSSSISSATGIIYPGRLGKVSGATPYSTGDMHEETVMSCASFENAASTATLLPQGHVLVPILAVGAESPHGSRSTTDSKTASRASSARSPHLQIVSTEGVASWVLETAREVQLAPSPGSMTKGRLRLPALKSAAALSRGTSGASDGSL